MRCLDTKGLKCPLPVLKAAKAMKTVAPGEALEVLATDPGSVDDFTAYCRTTGHDLEVEEQRGEVFRFVIRHRVSGPTQA